MLNRDADERRRPPRTVTLLCAAGLLGAGATAIAQQGGAQSPDEATPQGLGQPQGLAPTQDVRPQNPQQRNLQPQRSETSSPDPQQEPPSASRTEQEPTEAATRELEQARRELEAARREVEQAAREMAQRQREQAALERRQAQLERQQIQREQQQAQREQQLAQRERVREQQAALEQSSRERAAAGEQRRAEREQSRSELERARQELQAARRNLEEAAREVAQLSARAVAPIVEDFQLQWLGTGQRATLGLVVEDAPNGARISGVSPGGPAEEAGVRIGDVIVGIDGRALDASAGRPSRVLIERLSEVEPGAVVSLEVIRDGDTRNVPVETRERDDRVLAFEAPRFQALRNFFQPAGRWSSMELVTLTPELGAYFGTERGLLVVRAPEDEALMLQDGDVILDIGGREPNSPEHAMRILGTFEPGETVELTIMRRQQRQTLAVPLTDEDGNENEPANEGESANGETADDESV